MYTVPIDRITFFYYNKKGCLNSLLNWSTKIGINHLRKLHDLEKKNVYGFGGYQLYYFFQCIGFFERFGVKAILVLNFKL